MTSFSDLTTNMIPLSIRMEQSKNSGKIEEDVTQFSCSKEDLSSSSFSTGMHQQNFPSI
ncbi:hypothetical protein Hanom_Chr05g00418631 [Helianthus anomalus]